MDGVGRFMAIIEQLIDNDTLIIIGMTLLAFHSPEHRELIAAALVGYLGAKVKPSG